MLTYNLENKEGPLYERIYSYIKKDIISGNLVANTKLPSKRSFANQNGISVITVQNAYEQLLSEGYIYTKPRKGYYISKIETIEKNIQHRENFDSIDLINQNRNKKYKIDLSNNGIEAESFPFSIWAKISRNVLSNKKKDIMEISLVGGKYELRKAIADHLNYFRGMKVDPSQIIIGAGTEYLYTLIIQLLGNDKIYCLENPGYKKLLNVYEQNGITCKYINIDNYGIKKDGLINNNAQIAHISPNHHFPTGIIMPITRRYEILSWANSDIKNYIIEDDYDSEFRLKGKPIPTLYSIDENEKVIYMNTFSKSLSPTIRISYMVLPSHLVKQFYDKLSFYSCTVSNLEQLTLAEFIKNGYFERHINRMRLYYMKKRKEIIDMIKSSKLNSKCKILEQHSGLHFLIKLKTSLPDKEIIKNLNDNDIQVRALSDYYFNNIDESKHLFIINYSNINLSKDENIFDTIAKLI